jgi:Kelch motif
VDTEQWEVVTEIPTPKFHAGVVAINNRIYIIGGFCSDDIFRHTAAKIECYNIETNLWTCLNEYPKNIWEHSMDLLYIPKFNDTEALDEQRKVQRDTTVSWVPDEEVVVAVAAGGDGNGT